MGRLDFRRRRTLRYTAINWIAPALLSIAIVVGFNTLAQADTPPTTSQLAGYLQNNSLNLGTDSVDGYQQIYYTYNGQRIYITSASYSHLHPVASGQYVAWQGQINGAGQIFLYDMLTHSLTQLTSSSTNQNPSIYNNTVTWEGWQNNSWQIYYYDGLKISQITAYADSCVNASSNGRQIIYAHKLNAGGWQAESYDLSTGKAVVLKAGNEAATAYPRFKKDNTISTKFVN